MSHQNDILRTFSPRLVDRALDFLDDRIAGLVLHEVVDCLSGLVLKILRRQLCHYFRGSNSDESYLLSADFLNDIRL